MLRRRGFGMRDVAVGGGEMVVVECLVLVVCILS